MSLKLRAELREGGTVSLLALEVLIASSDKQPFDFAIAQCKQNPAVPSPSLQQGFLYYHNHRTFSRKLDRSE